MENLIITAACGLKVKEVEFFLKSLRNYYNEKIFFVIGKNDLKIKKLLNIYNCNFLEVSVHRSEIQLKRYHFFLKILEEKEYKNVLFCDSRDIYFQSNPFDFNYKGSINYFLEDKRIKDCSINSYWLRRTYGKKVYKLLSDKIISCGGTILGSHKSLKKFLSMMIDETSKHRFKKRLKYLLTFRRDKTSRGSDQSHGNFIAHNKLIDNTYFYANESGPVATVFHLKKIKFNNNFQLVNSLDMPYSIVHQYDKRWGEFENNVRMFKSTLGIK